MANKPGPDKTFHGMPKEIFAMYDNGDDPSLMLAQPNINDLLENENETKNVGKYALIEVMKVKRILDIKDVKKCNE